MVLKQSLALSLPTIKNVRFSPRDITGLVAWYKFQESIAADQDAAGSTLSPPHRTSDGNMAIGDRINLWTDIIGGNAATQADEDVKPRWNIYGSAPVTEKPNCHFDGNQYMNMASDIEIDENENFSIMCHVIFSSLNQKAVYGSNANNFFRIQSDSGFRCKIGGTGNSNFTEATDTIVTDKDFIITIQRSGGVAGNLRCYVHQDTMYDDKIWGVTTNDDPDAFVINNIGASADGSNNFEGVIKNLIIYKDHVLSATERKNLYIYLKSLL